MAGTGNSPSRAAHSLIAQAFGDVLGRARKRCDLSAEHVAAAAGISIARLFAIEHAHMNPRLDQLYRVAAALDMSRTRLLDEDIGWLTPHADTPPEAAACVRITVQEARFVHQLISGVHAPVRR
jgi:transcriptional regulator with XRE-family HTH domain